MYDFDSIKSAKKKAEVHQESKKEEYDDIYNEAVGLVREFGKNNDLNILKSAADKFGECIQMKSNLPGPYYNLACIFYMIDNSRMCLEYLKEVQSIDPGYPGLTEAMKMVLTQKDEEPESIVTEEV